MTDKQKLYQPASHRLWFRGTTRSHWRTLAIGSEIHCQTEMQRLQNEGIHGDWSVLVIDQHPRQTIGGR